MIAAAVTAAEALATGPSWLSDGLVVVVLLAVGVGVLLGAIVRRRREPQHQR